MIERQWIFSYKENIHQIYWNQYAPSCSVYIDWYNTQSKVSYALITYKASHRWSILYDIFWNDKMRVLFDRNT